MKTKTIDMIRLPCPKPMLEAKKALSDEATKGIIVKVDNLPCVQNLEKMSESFGYDFSFFKISKDIFEVTINKKIQPHATRHHPSTYYPPTGISIGSDTMGSGEKELGKVLIKGFIYSLTELDISPKFIAFFNSGVYLTNEKANTVKDLKKLEEKGTEILSCGTCLNYYNLTTPAVGTVANMYEITEKLTSINCVVNI